LRVGTLRVDFRIPGSDSLKAKRKVMRSLKDRIRGRFPVAVAEVGYQDLHARGLLGIAAVAEEGRVVERVLDEVQRMIEGELRILVVDVTRDSI
jgi:uncharacterized protein YlxP (DUF503 family)